MSDDYTRAVPPTGTPTTTIDPLYPTETPSPDLHDDGDDRATPGVTEKVKGLAGSAGDAGSSVLDEAKSGASDVKQEAQQQVSDLWGQARGELSDQTGQQQQRLAGGLKSFGSQLDQMASAPDESSVATHLARDLSQRATYLGGWLESRSPQEVVDELRSFARRRPGTFLLAAAGAGLLVGRLTRALKDGPADQSDAPRTTGAVDGTTRPTSSYESTPTEPYENLGTTPGTGGGL